MVTIPLLTALLVGAISAAPTCSSKPPNFLLAGDSTTAKQSSGGGGWGNGFLTFLTNGAKGTNYGHNGATTASFVSGGDWANVLAAVKASTASYAPVVTIQFGHNDQKATSGVSLSQYQTNLQNLASDVVKAGGTPILVTPLTRRSFSSEHTASDSLAQQRTTTIAAANAVGAAYIDLNTASLAYVDAIGKEAAQVYNLNADDTTHLNDHGSVVFGRLVADLLLGHAPTIGAGQGTWTPSGCYKSFIGLNDTLSELIWTGKPA